MSGPNIVIIMADQLAPQFTSTYGNTKVKTPNMDQIAATGMRFDSAYCNVIWLLLLLYADERQFR